MNRDNKIILLASLVILASLISSSITGKAVNKKIAKISISPRVVNNEENVYLTVVPGEDGVNEEAIFYNSNGIKLTSTSLCSSYKCTEPTTISFTIPNWEEGVYQVKVYDYALKDFINGDFTIKGGF